jgi:lipoate-protein ligase A
MSRDADMLRAGVPAARVYYWDGPWVSLGRSQVAEKVLLDPEGVRWVKRPTGGSAVLHGHDVTVSLVLRVVRERSIRDTYRTAIAPLVGALRRFGIDAELGEDSPYVSVGARAVDCFKHISPNDVIDLRTGRKLIGTAMRVTGGFALAQCSIPVGYPLLDPAAMYASPHTALPLDVEERELVNAITSELAAFHGNGNTGVGLS